MGATKHELFTDYQNKIAEMAKAISHPARVAILEVIMQKGACVCGDIVEELPLSQSTVSQHLKELKKAGILKGEIDGPYRCYCLNDKECKAFGGMLVKLFSKLTNCC